MGSRNKKANPVLIDFETGESKVDEISELRQIQNQLYRLDNPYVGNKRGILVDIVDALEKNGVPMVNSGLKNEQVLDLFSGSGVVSTFFKLLGKTVVSNDLLTSSFYNAAIFLESHHDLLTREELDWLCKNQNPNQGRFIQDNYAERFTPEEAQFLDNYRANVETLVDRKAKEMDEAEKKVMGGYNGYYKERMPLLWRAAAIVTVEHYVLNRCFLGGRLNKGQVLADLEHRLAHDRNKGDSMQFALDPLPTFPYLDDDMGCRAYNMDALEATGEIRKAYPGIQLAYIDPPYGGAQSDYASMFAFCEEYVYGQKLDTLPHLEEASKKFAKKKDYKDHFRAVLDGANWIPTWAVSFNASSFSDAEGIISILKEFKKDVLAVNINHEYRYRKERGQATEYLFVAR